MLIIAGDVLKYKCGVAETGVSIKSVTTILSELIIDL
jgi:hypothetical protein